MTEVLQHKKVDLDPTSGPNINSISDDWVVAGCKLHCEISFLEVVPGLHGFTHTQVIIIKKKNNLKWHIKSLNKPETIWNNFRCEMVDNINKKLIFKLNNKKNIKK